jgi:hypothetical protein
MWTYQNTTDLAHMSKEEVKNITFICSKCTKIKDLKKINSNSKTAKLDHILTRIDSFEAFVSEIKIDHSLILRLQDEVQCLKSILDSVRNDLQIIKDSQKKGLANVPVVAMTINKTFAQAVKNSTHGLTDVSS